MSTPRPNWARLDACRPRNPEPTRKLTIEVSQKTLKALRLAAVHEDTTVEALVTRLIERYLGRKGD